MKTYYKVKENKYIILMGKKRTPDYINLVKDELLTANYVLKLGYSLQDLPPFLELVKVKNTYWFFGARFEDKRELK